MNVQIDENMVEVPESACIADALKAGLSGKKFKSVVACGVEPSVILDGEEYTMLDLGAPLPEGTKVLRPIFLDSEEGLDLLRHSTSHVMAAAVQKLFKGTKVTIGPSIDNGFYYDFDAARPFTPEDFAAIEAEMKNMIKAAMPFTHTVMEKNAAIEHFTKLGETYKAEIIAGIEADKVSFYQCGDFLDLCRGPHIPHTGFIKAFTLLSVAGAYWRGDEKNKMLSRIYGTAFADEKALKAYLHCLEEAKRRDHRKLGRELELFTFYEDVAPGMVFWLPKGMLLRTILEDFWRKEHLKRQYGIVQGPQLLRVETWQKSGHYDNYRENMYFTSIEDDAYGVKPMNCIAHMLIYKNNLRSYRELPQRYFELGLVHRHEMSGALHGLMRVRQFTQDDAHVLCMPEQLEGEIIKIIDLIADLMGIFNFEYKVVVSTRPEKSIGTDEAWELATNALIQAAQKVGIEYAINEGDGAFYGPKIDVKLLDSLGREWQCSTIQCDFTLPERFELEYVGQDGERHRPVMLHRAIMGSMERFVGILIEHFAGAMPTWIAPEQARLLTVTDAQHTFSVVAEKVLQDAGVRVHADTRNEKLGFKVREAQMSKIPYILVIGDKEVEAGGVNVRLRNGENLGLKTLAEVVELIKADCDEPFKQRGMHYRFA